MDDIILKRFENPDEVRTFEKGKFEVIKIGGMTIGRATAFKDGEVHTMKSGDLFYIGPMPHDSWGVGDEEYVSLHFQGADKYAD